MFQIEPPFRRLTHNGSPVPRALPGHGIAWWQDRTEYAAKGIDKRVIYVRNDSTVPIASTAPRLSHCVNLSVECGPLNLSIRGIGRD